MKLHFERNDDKKLNFLLRFHAYLNNVVNMNKMGLPFFLSNLPVPSYWIYQPTWNNLCHNWAYEKKLLYVYEKCIVCFDSTIYRSFTEIYRAHYNDSFWYL